MVAERSADPRACHAARMRHRLSILLGGLLVGLAIPASCSAAQSQFYAAPSGSGTACTPQAPCSVASALTEATGNSDTITLASGSYGSAANPLPPLPQNSSFGLTLQGTPGQPTPRLFIDTSSAAPAYAFALISTGIATLRDLSITALGGNDEGVLASSFDHVEVIDTAGIVACWPQKEVIDSACVALASSAYAIDDGGTDGGGPNSITLNHDTFYAPSGTAAYLWPQDFTLTVNATDSIFDGGVEDIDGSGSGAKGGELVVQPSYDAFSNVKPVGLIKGGSHNITATPPSFVDPATGDVHEETGSSTINTGTENNTGGPTDLGGGPRWIGTKMDIGAYEAPTAPRLYESDTGHDGVSALVNPDGADASVTLRYGATPSYGSSETIDAGSGVAPVAELLAVSGFAPGATYYYELSVTNALGSSEPFAGSFSASQERFASPSGSALAPCTLAAPCDLATAVNGASSQQEVVLASGSYGSSAKPLITPLHNTSTITIDGSSPAPQIFLSTPGTSALQLIEFSRVSGVDIYDVGASDEGTFITGVVDHDLIVAQHASGACEAFDGSVYADTACIAEAPNAKAFDSVISAGGSEPAALAFDHDTLLALGGVALDVSANGFPLTASASDSIFHGTTDVQTAIGAGVASGAAFIAEHSDYTNIDPGPGSSVTAPGTATNITAPPLFLDVAHGDLHEAAGSPTIDAGGPDPFGSLTDLAGTPRTIGPATDIGAYEAIEAPSVSAVSTSGVGQSTLTVLASVNPNFGDTSVHVDYGTTTAYGSSTVPIDLGTSLAAVPVSIPLSGLTPGVTYHLRVSATNATGTTNSSDLTVSTVALVGVTAPGIVPPPGKLTVASSAIVKGTSAAVTLSCGPSVASLSRGCQGTLRLTIKQKRRVRKGKHTVTKLLSVAVGNATFALTGGQRKTITVHLTALVIAAIKHAKHHKLSVGLEILRNDGAAKTSGALTLLPAPAKKSKAKKKH
jgi:hypothetical protein